MSHTSLRRYTNLVATIQILRQQAMTLLNPELWDDKNDSYGMRQYMNALGARSVLALCFAEQHETYHHWKVFSSGHDGVCIQFNKDVLLGYFQDRVGIRSGVVDYREIRNMRTAPPLRDELPFVKRFPYRDEKEFRLVYVDMQEKIGFKDFPIGLDCIERINLSPWIPRSLADSVRSTIRSIPGCSHMNVSRSTLVENDQWKKHLDRAVAPHEE